MGGSAKTADPLRSCPSTPRGYHVLQSSKRGVPASVLARNLNPAFMVGAGPKTAVEIVRVHIDPSERPNRAHASFVS